MPSVARALGSRAGRPHGALGSRAYLYLGNYSQGWADYEIRKVTGRLPARQR
jgi:hypothetical protein